MKQYLLAGLFCAATLAMAASPAPTSRKLANGVTMTEHSGVKRIHFTDDRGSNKIQLKHAAKAAAVASRAAEELSLFESFEGWDGSSNDWTPEGWTVESKTGIDRSYGWTPSGSVYEIVPSDGRVMYGVNYSALQQDEWLISPAVTIEDGEELAYHVYLSPFYIFSIDNIDWDNMVYDGDKIVAETLQVLAKPEGGDWELLRDFANDYKDKSIDELLDLEFTGLQKRSEDLSAYVGKTVQFAFRVVGADGNTICIDEISVGLPSLDNVSYIEPASTLYWGLTREENFSGLMADIAIHPVFEPITWYNNSSEDNAVYTWTYTDPITGREAHSDNAEELTLTFVPDYSTDEFKRNNFFRPPMLTATAPKATPASYMPGHVYMQAGGKAERTLEDGSEFEASLLSFAYNTDGFAPLMVDEQTIGDYALPVFGYNVNSDRFWLNYSIKNPDDVIEGNFAHLEGLANLLMPTAAPLVVNGVTVYGFGKIADDAKFAATIYGVNEEMSRDFESLTVIATDTIMGSEVLGLDKGIRASLCFPFDFDESVVVKATDKHPAYFVFFSGFRSDKVDFFAPYQSMPSGESYVLGYILNEIRLNGHGTFRGDDPYYNLKPMTYYANGDYYDPAGAFAIGLEAEYPWLTTDCEGLELGADDAEAVAMLGSYYDGSKLSVEVPEGLSATVAGRYDECKLTVSRAGSNAVDGVVKVSGPGVEVTIPVKAVQSGISEIIAGGNGAAEIYDLSGRRVNCSAKGIVIVKGADGNVSKSLLK
ncbi:MAG: choice-of-anchor J domain-containing protein [Muribaculaceae bacterium]|nr:choice-of-anchor J domain-containing protein [Muribaculaceae bacterium]